MNKDFAFILGNGITRLQVDCEGLLDYGYVYGCNRIYQEFAPTVLVSTDAGMAREIQGSGYSSRYTHYTRKKHIIKNHGSRVLPTHLHDYSSGPAALGIAASSDSNYLFMIGMDLKGKNNMINNIYAGTPNYLDNNADPTFFGNWVDQVNTLMKLYSNKRFFHVNPLDNFTDESFRKNPNFTVMTLEEFKRMINKV